MKNKSAIIQGSSFSVFARSIAIFLCICLILCESTSYAAPSLRGEEKSLPVIPAKAGIHGSPLKACGDDTSCQIASLPPNFADGSADASVADPSVARNDIVKISIPSELGTIDESFHGTSGKTILYIQDAHDSLEAQENIAKIINHLVEHHGVTTVFEEGYEGPVRSDEFFGFIKDPIIKEKVSYFLMDKLRIGGAEYAHINRFHLSSPHAFGGDPLSGSPTKTFGDDKKHVDFKLIGADDLKLHRENINAYRKNAKYQKQILQDLEAMHREIRILANLYFSKEMKEWMKLKERYEKGELPPLDYMKRLASLRGAQRRSNLLLNQIASPAARNDLDIKAFFETMDAFENDIAHKYLKTDRDYQVFQYHKDLSMLKRLVQIKLTPEEYEAVRGKRGQARSSQSVPVPFFKTQDIANFIAREGKKSLVLSKKWESQLENAIQFYELAHQRDLAVEKTLTEYLEPLSLRGASIDATKQSVFKNQIASPAARNDKESSAVLVFGGFHKESIRKILMQSGHSFVIVTPKISALDPLHQAYYKQLMSVGYHPFEVPLYVRQAARAESRFLQVKEGGPPIEAAFRNELRTLSKSFQRKTHSNEESTSSRAEVRRISPAISWVINEIRRLETEYAMVILQRKGNKTIQKAYQNLVRRIHSFEKNAKGERTRQIFADYLEHLDQLHQGIKEVLGTKPFSEKVEQLQKQLESQETEIDSLTRGLKWGTNGQIDWEKSKEILSQLGIAEAERARISIRLEKAEKEVNDSIDNDLRQLAGEAQKFETFLYSKIFLNGNKENEQLLLDIIMSRLHHPTTSEFMALKSSRQMYQWMRESEDITAENVENGIGDITPALRSNPQAQKILEQNIGKDFQRLKRRFLLRRIAKAAAAGISSLVVAAVLMRAPDSKPPILPEQTPPRTGQKDHKNLEDQANQPQIANQWIGEAFSPLEDDMPFDVSKETASEEEKALETEMAEKIGALEKKSEDLGKEVTKAIREDLADELEELKKRGKEKKEERPKESLPEKWEQLTPLDKPKIAKKDVTTKIPGLPEPKPLKVTQGEYKHRDNVWYAQASPDLRYLATGSYTTLNPITGELLPSKSEWEPWPLENRGVATRWVVTNASGADGFIIPMPPHYVVVSIETEHPAKGSVYLDRNNRMWHLKGVTSGKIKVHIRPAQKGELPPIGQIQIDERVAKTWRETLPKPLQEILKQSKPLSLQQRKKVKNEIMRLMFYTQNSLLEHVEPRDNSLGRIMAYFAGECDPLTLMNALLHYELAIPGLIQGGFLDADGDGTFYFRNGHLWLTNESGIDESTSYAREISDFHQKEVTDKDWKAEMEFLRKRAERILTQLHNLVEKIQAQIEVARIQTDLGGKRRNTEEPQKSENYYSRLNKKYRDRFEKQILNRSIGEQDAGELIKQILNVQSSLKSKNLYQLMARGHYLLGILKHIANSGHIHGDVREQAQQAKKTIYDAIQRVASKNDWILKEPLSFRSQEDHFFNYYTGTPNDFIRDFPSEVSEFVDILSGEQFITGKYHEISNYSQGMMEVHRGDDATVIVSRLREEEGETSVPVEEGDDYFVDETMGLRESWLVRMSFLNEREIIGPRLAEMGLVFDDFKVSEFWISHTGFWIAQIESKTEPGRVKYVAAEGEDISSLNTGASYRNIRFAPNSSLWIAEMYYPSPISFVGPLAEKVGIPEKADVDRIIFSPQGSVLLILNAGQWSHFGGPLAKQAGISGTEFKLLKELRFSADGRLLAVVQFNDDIDFIMGPLAGREALQFKEVHIEVFQADGKWLARVQYLNGQWGFVGLLAQEFGLTNERYDKIGGISVRPNKLWMASVQINGIWRIIGPFAEQVGIRHQTFRGGGSVAILSDGRWIATDKVKREDGEWRKFIGPLAQDFRQEFKRKEDDYDYIFRFNVKEMESGVVVVDIPRHSYSYSARRTPDFFQRIEYHYDIGHLSSAGQIPAYRFDLRWQYIYTIAADHPDIASKELTALLLDRKKYRLAPFLEPIYTNTVQIGEEIIKYHNPAKAAQVIRHHPGILYQLNSEALAELFLLLSRSPYENRIVDILTHVPKHVAQGLIKTSPFAERDWKRIMQNYLQAAYISALFYVDEDKEKIEQLNSFLESKLKNKQREANQQIQVSKTKELSYVLNLLTDQSKFKKSRLTGADLSSIFKKLREESEYPNRYYDVELAPETKSSPVRFVTELLRDNSELFTISLNPSTWTAAIQKQQQEREKWKETNERLTETLGEDFQGNQTIESVWSEFWQEYQNDAVAILLTIWFVYFVTSYLISDRLRNKDKIVGKSAQQVVAEIWKANPRFGGREQERAVAFLERLMGIDTVPTEAEIAAMEAFRSTLSRDQRMIFDLVNSVASQPTSKGIPSLAERALLRSSLEGFEAMSAYSRQWANLLDLLDQIPIFRKGRLTPHAERQKFNRRLLELSKAVEREKLSPHEVYQRLKTIRQEFAAEETAEESEKREKEILTFEELKKNVSENLHQIPRVYAQRSPRVSAKPDGNTSRRPGLGEEFLQTREYVHGDDIRAIAWKASARQEKLLVKQVSAEATKQMGILLDMRNLFDSSKQEDWITDLAKSLILALDKERVRGEKGYRLNQLIFLMSNGQIEIETLKARFPNLRTILSILQKRYKEASEIQLKQKSDTVDRRFYGDKEEENPSYRRRTRSVSDPTADISESLNSLLKQKMITERQDLYLAGISEGLRDRIIKDFAWAEIRGFEWKGNIAHLVRSEARKEKWGTKRFQIVINGNALGHWDFLFGRRDNPSSQNQSQGLHKLSRSDPSLFSPFSGKVDDDSHQRQINHNTADEGNQNEIPRTQESSQYERSQNNRGSIGGKLLESLELITRQIFHLRPDSNRSEVRVQSFEDKDKLEALMDKNFSHRTLRASLAETPLGAPVYDWFKKEFGITDKKRIKRIVAAYITPEGLKALREGTSIKEAQKAILFERQFRELDETVNVWWNQVMNIWGDAPIGHETANIEITIIPERNKLFLELGYLFFPHRSEPLTESSRGREHYTFDFVRDLSTARELLITRDRIQIPALDRKGAKAILKAVKIELERLVSQREGKKKDQPDYVIYSQLKRWIETQEWIQKGASWRILVGYKDKHKPMEPGYPQTGEILDPNLNSHYIKTEAASLLKGMGRDLKRLAQSKKELETIFEKVSKILSEEEISHELLQDLKIKEPQQWIEDWDRETTRLFSQMEELELLSEQFDQVNEERLKRNEGKKALRKKLREATEFPSDLGKSIAEDFDKPSKSLEELSRIAIRHHNLALRIYKSLNTRIARLEEIENALGGRSEMRSARNKQELQMRDLLAEFREDHEMNLNVETFKKDFGQGLSSSSTSHIESIDLTMKPDSKSGAFDLLLHYQHHMSRRYYGYEHYDPHDRTMYGPFGRHPFMTQREKEAESSSQLYAEDLIKTKIVDPQEAIAFLVKLENELEMLSHQRRKKSGPDPYPKFKLWIEQQREIPSGAVWKAWTNVPQYSMLTVHQGSFRKIFYDEIKLRADRFTERVEVIRELQAQDGMLSIKLADLISIENLAALGIAEPERWIEDWKREAMRKRSQLEQLEMLKTKNDKVWSEIERFERRNQKKSTRRRPEDKNEMIFLINHPEVKERIKIRNKIHALDNQILRLSSQILRTLHQRIARLEEIDHLRPDSTRSEMRKIKSHSEVAPSKWKGTFLINADRFDDLKYKNELFAALYLHPKELRLLVINEHGQIAAKDLALRAILELNNTQLIREPLSEVALEKYGIPNSTGIQLLTPGEEFRRSPDAFIKAVLLKEGMIEWSTRLAMNGGFLPEMQEDNGLIKAPEHILAELVRSELRYRVIAYAA